MERIYLIDDHEPWYKGDPEIMMQMNLANAPGYRVWKGPFAMVNKERKWYAVDRWLFDWYRDDAEGNTDYGDVAAIMWWEEDIGSDLMKIELKYTFPNGREITFTFSLTDNDDEMGSLIMNFRDPLDRGIMPLS